jgi:4a-hydroxytetrahydrobiopterin dehydratase
MATPLQEKEIHAQLADLPGWQYDGRFISKNFVFADFTAAFAFMVRVAFIAESMGHHPDWSNVYRSVKIQLRTHDADGITALDMEMAKGIEALG